MARLRHARYTQTVAVWGRVPTTERLLIYIVGDTGERPADNGRGFSHSRICSILCPAAHRRPQKSKNPSVRLNNTFFFLVTVN